MVVAGTTQGTNVNQFTNPTCLYIDGNGTLYICDYDNNRIQKWDNGATSGVTVAGNSGGTSGQTSTLLNSPIDLVFDKSGYMYVVDYQNHRVQRFPPNSNIGTTVAGGPGRTNSFTDLEHPTAIDIDSNSNIYILDMHNYRIMKWTSNATSGTSVINSSLINYSHDLLLSPSSSNQVYTSNDNTGNIYLWTFGNSNPTLTLNQVNDTENVLNKPMGMAFDPYGNLYVADSGNNRIVMYYANSTVGIVVAGDNSTTPVLDNPTDIAFDSNLNLYVVISNGDQVIKLTR